MILEQTCGHSPSEWIESYPVGNGYCRACIHEEYESAPRCPKCGTPKGFAWGTGDCGCGDEYRSVYYDD